MKNFHPIVIALCAAAMVAGCSQENAPSDAITNAADKVVQRVDGTAALKLAEGPLAPRDDCAKIDGASAFRAQLAAAVQAKDADKLVALVAPDIKLDFGGGGGVAELRKRLAADDVLWGELADLMQLGCVASKDGGIVIPWLFEQDLGDRDPMVAMIVTGEKVPVHEAADPASKTIETVSWDAVELIGGLIPDSDLQHVKLADGKTGYVAADRMRSLLDYRLYASSRDGKWSITSIVAGD